MECVLGVSLTPTTVRMVLVEGAAADGATVDHDSVDIAVVDGPDELISAIVGTRESSVASGHRLITTGVAWTDRASAAQLRKALRARGVADVVLVSELHAAGALAQAVGRTVGYERTALMFLEGDTASLSVVDTATGAVVGVQTRRLQPADVMADLREMIVSLERLADQPDGVFVVGSGADIAEAKSQISTVTALPVHAPDDADLALARGAALAAAQAPRCEATTVGLTPARDTDDTGALATQLADAGYMAPLGYSQVDDDFDDGFGDDFLDGLDGESEELDPTFEDEDRKPFLLVGSALTSVFVVGVVALVISLAVSIRPAAEQHPAPAASARTRGCAGSGGRARARPRRAHPGGAGASGAGRSGSAGGDSGSGVHSSGECCSATTASAHPASASARGYGPALPGIAEFAKSVPIDFAYHWAGADRDGFTAVADPDAGSADSGSADAGPADSGPADGG